VDPFTARTLPPSKRIALAGGTDVRAYAVGRTTATGLQLGLDTGRWAYGLRHGYVESAEMRRSAHEVGLYATWYVKSYWFNEFNFRLGVGVTTTVLFHPAGSVLSMSSASHGEMGFPITRKVRATVGLETGATSAAGKAGQQSAFRGLFLGFTAASHFDL
jgi:hypothetical protein